MNENIPQEVVAAFDRKYAWLKTEQYPSVGPANSTGIYRTPDGGWQCNYENYAAITLRPGDSEPHEIHGGICARWYGEGGKFNEKGDAGWLGWPISDEEPYPDAGDPEDRISHLEGGDVIWTKKTGNCHNVVRNKALWYENRRNKLLSLLDRTTSLEITNEVSSELRRIMKKCQEDSFEIALVGEFQGGKSTTFNALCDGRDLSPRGLGGGGIKTSAAVISAQNIADGETRNGMSEWAEVSFKSDADIALSLVTILRSSLAKSKEFRNLFSDKSDEKFNECFSSDSQLGEILCLDNPQHRQVIGSIISELWKDWNENRGKWTSDALDQLRIATLQMRFYNECRERYGANEESTILPVDKFQALVAFPKDWEPRWKNGASAEFNFDEIAFVFIASVLVRIHSENLKRLGCRITDCPGLFANAYDTSVAQRVIANADAIWYLINGEKQAGEKDLKILKSIADMGMTDKNEATMNIKGSHEDKIREILPVTQSILENNGINVEVQPYNARLAFLAMQGARLAENPASLTPTDINNMRVDAKDKEGTKSPQQMWIKMVNKAGGSTEIEALEDIETVDRESAATVRRESLLDGVMTRLEDDFLPMKSYSILVSNGSDKAARALSRYEGDLQATEKAAEAKRNEWAAKVEAAKKELDEFVAKSNEVIDRSDFADEKGYLAAEIANEITESALNEEFVNKLSTIITEQFSGIRGEFFLNEGTMREALIQRITPPASEAYKCTMVRAIESWKSFSNATGSRNKAEKRLADVCANIHDLWNSRRLDENLMLSGLELPTLSDDVIGEVARGFTNKILTDTEIKNLAEELRVGIFSFAWKIIWNVLLFPASAILSLFGFNQEPDYFHKIKPEISKLFSSLDFRARISDSLKNEMAQSLRQIGQQLRSQLSALQRDFETERVGKNQAMFEKSQAERDRIAEENRKIRVEQIVPLRKEIEAFASSVRADLKSN